MSTGTFVDQEKMLLSFGLALEKDTPALIAGPLAAIPGTDFCDSCPEKIEVTRLDEGFCVRHHKPREIPVVEGEGWRGDQQDGLLASMMKMIDARAGEPVEVYGFRSAAEVVEYVRSARERHELA